MDGFNVYKYYMAVKLHFTTDGYDVFETNGHVKGSRDVFSSRNDRFIFEKLGRKFDKPFDVIQYFVANFAYGNDAVVYCDAESDANLVTWQRRKQSLTQTFKNDIDAILLHVEKNKHTHDRVFKFVQSDHPELLKLFLGSHISIETMVILDSFEDYLSAWKSNTNLLWEEEYRRIIKCKRFIKFDSYKLVEIYQELKEGFNF